jgi:translation initiation factor 2B subunit (eIF-2B alpha/beta/delta family)
LAVIKRLLRNEKYVKRKNMKCKHCKIKFEQKYSSLEKYCNDDICQNLMIKEAITKSKAKKVKEQRKEKKEALERLKTNSDWLKDCQRVVNKYIRERDKDVKTCISCSKSIKGVRHASHYLSSGGHSSVRFNTDNIWVSCYKCNVMLSGNLLKYRIRLIKKIGIERVEYLESIANETRRYSVDELKEIMKEFKEKIKQLENNSYI